MIIWSIEGFKVCFIQRSGLYPIQLYIGYSYSRMAAKSTAKSFLRLGRFLGSLICWIVFSFWASQGVEKYLSNPVSSSISFTNGDDGLENLNYPAITICASGYINFLSFLTLIVANDWSWIASWGPNRHITLILIRNNVIFFSQCSYYLKSFNFDKNCFEN